MPCYDLRRDVNMDRAFILNEIRRTTVENGGTPLGRDRFLAATGIREHDWNRFWARWSDALRDAGFGGNQFNSAIPDETLLEHLAAVVRELGRFPVVRELKVKAHADPSFPDSKTFQRLGSVRQLAERLKAFAIERGYDDVAALCPVISNEAQPIDRPKAIVLGSVYLMKSGKFFKIGHSNAVGRREREIAIQLPEKLRVVHEIKTDDPAGIEDYWHRRFADQRRNGEWFDLTPDQVSKFRRRKVM
jgi:hypothetical protein